MTTKAILWDLDGVLVRTEYLYFFATRDVLNVFDINLGEDEFHRLFYLNNRDPLRVVIEQRNLGNIDFLIYHKRRLKIFMDLLANEDITIEGAADTVYRLANHYVMGVVTGSKREQVEIISSRMPFFSCFDFVVALEDVSKSKPAPEPYLQAIARSGQNSASCLAIEDSVKGLNSAVAAGIQCWVIPNAMTCRSDFSQADKILSTISEVGFQLDISKEHAADYRSGKNSIS